MEYAIGRQLVEAERPAPRAQHENLSLNLAPVPPAKVAEIRPRTSARSAIRLVTLPPSGEEIGANDNFAAALVRADLICCHRSGPSSARHPHKLEARSAVIHDVKQRDLLVHCPSGAIRITSPIFRKSRQGDEVFGLLKLFAAASTTEVFSLL